MARRLTPALISVVIILAVWTHAAQGQSGGQSSKTPVATPTPAVPSSDSVSIADIQRAADQLAIAVQAAVKQATEDPALKVAALKVATNAVTAAQVVISQQAATLQTVLDSLAREIATATEKQQTKQKSH